MAAVSKHHCSFIRSAPMSYVRRVKGLFALCLNRHTEDFNDLEHGKCSGVCGGGGAACWVLLIFACRCLEEVCVGVCEGNSRGGKSTTLCPQIRKCSVVVSLKWNSWLFVNLAHCSHWTKLQRTWTLVHVSGLGNWNVGCVCVCSAYSFPPRQSELSNLYEVKRWPHWSHNPVFCF